MPFPMVHLLIAREVLKRATAGWDADAFYLGSLAPDAVHYRPGFCGEYKKTSHLCVGEQSWGEITNNDEWAEHVLGRLRRAIRSEDSFLCGYCIHILADIYNNIHIWMPFVEGHRQELKKGYGSSLHVENAAVDLQLYQISPCRDEIFTCLDRAGAADVPGLVSRQEVEAMAHNILRRQYRDKAAADASKNAMATLEGAQVFIGDAARFIQEIAASLCLHSRRTPVHRL